MSKVKTCRLEYTLGKTEFAFTESEHGTLVKFEIDGVDFTHDSKAIAYATMMLEDSGVNFQRDISVEMEKQNDGKHESYRAYREVAKP